MPLVEPLQIWQLEQNARNVRNISLFAHVDHGKSSLADHLIASNGIFHSKMASKMRYLDFRPDEVQRGITMKSAGISLIHQKIKAANSVSEQYVFHLIDNPGHLDFIQETFLTSYLTDGAIFLVDVVEGLTLSGRGMLFKLLDHRIPIILVLNKMDRLIIERKMTPNESYDLLITLISTINNAVGEWHKVNVIDTCEQLEVEWFEDFFHPLKDNVIFCSAQDGWAFRTVDFANLYSSMWDIPIQKIHSFLWGPFYPNPTVPDKASSINKLNPTLLKKAKLGTLHYCSVEWMFKIIWTIYSACGIEVVPAISVELPVILNKLKIELSGRDKMQVNGNKKNFSPKDCVSTVFRYWLPVSRCILEASIACFPDPILSARYRLNTAISNYDWFGFKWGLLVYPSKRFGGPSTGLIGKYVEYPPWSLYEFNENWQKYVFKGQMENDQLLAFNCKLVTAEEHDLIRPDTNLQLLEAEQALEHSVNIKSDSESVILGICRIYSGYLKPGHEYFVKLPRNAGELKLIVKSVFILMGRSYAQVPLLYPGSVGAIEFQDVEQSMLQRLRLFTFSNTGDFPDLTFQSEEEETALIKVALEPEDPRKYKEFLEGLDWINAIDPAVNIEHLKTGENVLICAGELHLERCLNDLKEYLGMGISVSEPLVPFKECVVGKMTKTINLESVSFTLTCFNSKDVEWTDSDHIKYGHSDYELLQSDSKKKKNILCGDKIKNVAFGAAVYSGFQLACANGPMCHEPLLNIGFIITEVVIHKEDEEWAKYSSAIRDVLTDIIMESGVRIALAMYEVDIDCLTESIGKVYQVVSKRKGFVVSEVMQEGTNFFTIKAKIPVVESMGVSDGN